MSVLSQKLCYFLEQRGLNVAELSRRCQIERSTLYQYLKGKRPLQNTAQLGAIMSELHLTPDERAEIMKAYEITQIGLRNYNRRCKVREILNSLLTIVEGTAAPPENEHEADLTPLEDHGLICGELDVNRTIHKVVRDTVAHGGELKLLAQPDYAVLMESLTLMGSESMNTKVTQVICMEADSGQDGCSNLENVYRILRYGVGIYHYEPRYYYGKASEHFGIMNVMPYLMVTEHYALQISSDRKAAILHSEPELVAYFGNVFERICKQSEPLIVSMDGFRGQQAQWALQYAKTMDFSHTIEVCSGLCSVQFWDERLIRTYMNPGLPGYEAIVQDYTAYTSALYEAKRRGEITVLMNASFAEEFIKTGIFREYPEVFFAKPVSQRDRRELVERILAAMDEGWYHIRMISAEDFPLSYRWELVIQRGLSLIFQYSFYNQFRVFQFLESDIMDAVYDFLEHLASAQNVLGDEQSVALLRKWEKEHLAE